MDKNIEQRVCVKFCVLNEISCAKTLEMLKKTFGDSTMSKTQVYDWYKSFKEGREEVNDLPRSGRPSASSTEENVDKIREMVLENRHYSLREIAQEMNMSHETARHILVDVLGMPVKELNAKKKKKEESKKPKTPEQLAKERAMREIEKVSLVRAKMAKIRKRPGKLSSVNDVRPGGSGGAVGGKAKKKRPGQSAFTNDLTDVSRSGALRLRSEANRHKKMSKIQSKKKTSTVKIANKAGKNKFNKGKNFGGPRFTKKDKKK